MKKDAMAKDEMKK